MKLALCVYGQPRLLDNIHVKNRLDSFVYNQAEVDVFVHTWSESSCIGSDWNNTAYKLVENYLGVVESTYKPKIMKVDKPLELSIDENIINKISHKRYFSEHNIKSVFSHLYSFQTCLSLVDGQYDFIFITRFDNLVMKFPDLNTLAKDVLYYTNQYDGRFSDASFILSTSIINKFKPYDNILDLLLSTDIITSERLKEEAFLMFNDKAFMKPTNLVCSIARSSCDEVGIL